MQRPTRHFRKLFVCELENRTTPAMMVSLSLNAVTFLGDGANDSLNLSVSPTGKLLHNLSGLDSATDPATGGTQEVNVADISTLTVDLAGGSDYVSFTNVSTAGSVSAESLLLETRNGGDYTLTNTSFTYNGKMMTTSGVGSVGFGCDNGDNTIDASAWTQTNLGIYGLAGNDVLQGGSGSDSIYGGDGDDVVEGHGGNDFLWGDTAGVSFSTGNDTLRGGPGNDSLWGDDQINNGNDILEGGDGSDFMVGHGGNDSLRDGVGSNTIYAGEGIDSVELYGTSNMDSIIVNAGSVTINGGTTTYYDAESLAVDAGAGIDEGTETAVNPLAYTVANLEPTVSIGEDVFNTDIPFVLNRGGSFKDIGSGQTWSATVDYAEGGGFVPLTLNANKTFTLNHAYSTGGVFNVTVRVVDNQGNVGTDSFLLVRPAGIQVGLVGGAQRSMIDQLTVSLAGNQTLLPGWYTFERTTPGPLPAIAITVSQVGNQTVAFFTFSGSDIIAGSLADGRYKLTLNSQFIRDPQNQQFDGDADNLPGGNFQFSFHRLFGDINGDAQVDGGADFAAFGASFGISSGPDFTRAFDYNGDGTVEGGTDFAEFGARFGLSI